MSPRHAHAGARRRGARPALALGALIAAVVLAAGTAITYAVFTDAAEADLGPVGGAYDIALVDSTGTIVQGNPDPLVIDSVVPGPDGTPVLEVDVVTTTKATGPVGLSLVNQRGEPLPSDPGFPDRPGVDPFDAARFTVTVDGEVVASDYDPTTGPIVLTGWEMDVAKRVQVSVSLTPALGNPYFYGRAMVLGLHFDGSTA